MPARRSHVHANTHIWGVRGLGIHPNTSKAHKLVEARAAKFGMIHFNRVSKGEQLPGCSW